MVNKDRSKYDAIFDTLGPVDGKVTGACKFSCCVVFFPTFSF